MEEAAIGQSLMNRAREELMKLAKVTKTKHRKQTKCKTNMEVSSLVKAKINEICVEENDCKQEKKKRKSKSKDSCENNTLSLGLHVNIGLANSTCEDKARCLKDKCKKTKSDESKKEKGVRKASADNIHRKEIESCQNGHKMDASYDNSIFHEDKGKKRKKEKKLLAYNLVEIESDQMVIKKKHKDKKSKKDEEGSLYESSDKIKKKKKVREQAESLEDSYSEIYSNQSVGNDKKKNKKKKAENVNESQTLNSSDTHKEKKKRKKTAKESVSSITDGSYCELESNIEEINISATDTYDTSSPSKRKRTKYKKDALEVEMQNGQEFNINKKKVKVAKISNKDMGGKHRHRENFEEFVELADLHKKSKKRKSSNMDAMQSESEWAEDDLTGMGSKCTKRKKKKNKKHKGEDTEFSNENNQEINTDETSNFDESDIKHKRKKRSLNGEMENAVLEHMPVTDSVVTTVSGKHHRRRDKESISVASYHCGDEKRKRKSKEKRTEITREMNVSCNAERQAENNCTSQSTVTPQRGTSSATFGLSPMERLLHGDPVSMPTESCTHCSYCSHSVASKPSPSIPSVVNTVSIKQVPNKTEQLQAVKRCVDEVIVDTLVIKKEPGLETESGNSEVTEPIHFIDVNNLNIKQEPGLETQTPSDHVNDLIDPNLSKDYDQQLNCVKREPGTEIHSNLNAAVSSENIPAPETECLLLRLKQEQVADGHIPTIDSATEASGQNESVENTSVVENTYLNSVITVEEGSSELLQHAPTTSSNVPDEEHHNAFLQKIPDRPGTLNTLADKPEVETNNIQNMAEYISFSQQWDSSKYVQSSKEASGMPSVPNRKLELREEWIYDLHLIDVPYRVRLHSIVNYFGVPKSKVREYHDRRRDGYKHVVVSFSRYSTCLEMSKKRHLLGSRHTFIWSFKKYVNHKS